MAKAKKKPNAGGKTKAKKKTNRKWLRIIGLLFFTAFAGSVILTGLYAFLNPPITLLMLQRCAEQSFDKDRSVRLQKTWKNMDEISPWIIRAVVASEDNLFPDHNGFDYKQIEMAKQESQRGKRLRGASTITQQTAKNVFLWSHRSYIRKGLEAYFTVLIEMFWSKERIMEVYLNVIEWGDGIYGIESASQHYFRKSSSRLNKQESALLAACLPNPLKRSPKRPSAFVLHRASEIAKLMDIIGPISLKKKTPPPISKAPSKSKI